MQFLSRTDGTDTVQCLVPSFSKYSLKMAQGESGDQHRATHTSAKVATSSATAENVHSLSIFRDQPTQGQGVASYSPRGSRIIINNGPEDSESSDEVPDTVNNESMGKHRSVFEAIRAPAVEKNSGGRNDKSFRDQPGRSPEVNKLQESSPFPNFGIAKDNDGDEAPISWQGLHGKKEFLPIAAPVNTPNSRKSPTSDLSFYPERIPAVVLSESSLGMLERVFVYYLDQCDIRWHENRVVVGPPIGNSAFLKNMGETVWEMPSPFADNLIDWRHVWSLMYALFGNIDLHFAGLQAYKADGCEVALRFLDWLRITLNERYPVEQTLDDDGEHFYEFIFGLLSVGNLAEAKTFAEEYEDYDLAFSIASHQRCHRSEADQSRLEQLLRQCESYKDPAVTKIMLLLSGKMSTSTRSACEGMDWLQCLGLYALYAEIEGDLSLEKILKSYEEAGTGFEDFAWTSPPAENAESSSASMSPPVLLFRVVQLFLGQAVTDSILQSNNKILDVCFRWITSRMLSCLQYQIGDDKDSRFSSEFAAALDVYDRWEYAVFVSLHEKPSASRDDRIRKFIAGSVRKYGNRTVGSLSSEEFLVDRLLLPREWVLQGRALHAVDNGSFLEATELFIVLKEFHRAAGILVHQLLPRPGLEKDYCVVHCQELFRVMDALKKAVQQDEDDELGHFRQYVPLFEMLETFCLLQADPQENDSTQVMIEKLGDDLAVVRRLAGVKHLGVVREVEEFVAKEAKVRQHPGVIQQLYGYVKNFWR